MNNRTFILAATLFAVSCTTAAKMVVERKNPFELQFSSRGPGSMINVGDIDEAGLAPVRAKIAAHVANGETDILLRIDSNGGSIFEGLRFIQELEEYKKLGIKVNCVVDTKAISMGFVILQASCDKRMATRRALFLAHNGSIAQTGGDAKTLQEDVDLLTVVNDNMSLICATRMGMDIKEYKRRLNDQASWVFGSEEALKYHAIDSIAIPSQLPPLDAEVFHDYASRDSASP